LVGCAAGEAEAFLAALVSTDDVRDPRRKCVRGFCGGVRAARRIRKGSVVSTAAREEDARSGEENESQGRRDADHLHVSL